MSNTNPLKMLKREDIQCEMANAMVDDYIYTNATHPIVQEMAEDASCKDWSDEDEDFYNENCHMIFIAMRAFLTKLINGYVGE